MPTNTFHLLSALSGTCAALLLSALPAAAAAVNETRCDYLGPEYGTACFTTRGESTFVETPSGNGVIQYNVRYDYTITRPAGYTLSGSGHDHWQQIVKRGEVQEYNYFIRKTVTDSRTGETCTIEEHFVYANGEVRHVDQDGTCRGDIVL